MTSAVAFSSGAIAVALLGALVSACARESAAPTTTPVQRLDVPRVDAGPLAQPPPAAQAEGNVTVSILSRDGGHWGAVLTLEPDPTTLVRSCATQALASDPTITGWALFVVGIPYGRATARLAEASALPASFLACVERTLSELQTVEGATSVGETLFYVTLR